MTFITGAVGPDHSVAVIAQVEDESGTMLEHWRLGLWQDGKWLAECALEYKPVAVCAYGESPSSWAVLGFEGEMTLVEGAIPTPKLTLSHILDSRDHAFTTVCRFNHGIAAAGMSRQVYWFDGITWERLGNRGLPDRSDELWGFEGLAASLGELYACGWEGEIWRFAGGIWHQVSSPTNITLTSVAIGSEGEVIACGRLGTLVRGNGDRWSVIDHQSTDEDFWSVANFQGRVYVSSMTANYELVGDQLIPVDDRSRGASYYHLASNSESMISVGATSVLLTWGSDWQQII